MSRKQTVIRTFLLPTFAIAFPLSFVWEMLQMFAYAPFGQSAAQTWLFCGLASLADALYIALLYWFGTRLTRDRSWIAQLSWRRLLALTLTAIVSATLIERIALSLGLWRYSDAMLQVPLLDVGFLPIIQLIVLPLMTFWFVRQLVE
jgi:hypothetical protein